MGTAKTLTSWLALLAFEPLLNKFFNEMLLPYLSSGGCVIPCCIFFTMCNNHFLINIFYQQILLTRWSLEIKFLRHPNNKDGWIKQLWKGKRFHYRSVSQLLQHTSVGQAREIPTVARESVDHRYSDLTVCHTGHHPDVCPWHESHRAAKYTVHALRGVGQF